MERVIMFDKEGVNVSNKQMDPDEVCDTVCGIDEIKDPWIHRSRDMKCQTCMWYINYKCRRHAPTLEGYPAVYPYDWCGDHKLDKVKMGCV